MINPSTIFILPILLCKAANDLSAKMLIIGSSILTKFYTAKVLCCMVQECYAKKINKLFLILVVCSFVCMVKVLVAQGYPGYNMSL